MDASAAKILIAKRACIEMGAKVISSFSEGSEPANVLGAIYPDCLEEILEEHPWSFALKTKALATLSDVPVDFGDGASVVYALPEDFLSLYKLNYPNAIFRQEILNGKNVILSNMAGLVIKYIFINDDPTTYTAKFRLALAFKLAATACFKIVEAVQNAALLQSKYDKALMTAMADDSKGSMPDQPIQDDIFYEKRAGAGAAVGLPNGNIGFFFGEGSG